MNAEARVATPQQPRAADIVECAGAPRDLGLDQGRGLRASIRNALLEARRSGAVPAAAFADGLSALWRSIARPGFVGRDASDVAALGRDLARYLPHLAERRSGLARGAGLPEQALDALLLATGERALAVAVELCPARAGGGVSLEVTLPAGAPDGGALRRSRPESGHTSLEWIHSWSVGALVHSRERGLVAVGALGPGRAPEAEEPSAPTCRAPAWLLVQQCLERFDDAEAATTWCLRRPAGGSLSIWLADARSTLIRVDVDEERRARHALAERPRFAAGGGGRDATPRSRTLTLDPARRTLRLGDGPELPAAGSP